MCWSRPDGRCFCLHSSIGPWSSAAGENPAEQADSGWPWLVFGSNAIVAYIISELLGTAIGLIRFTSDGHRDDALSFVYTHMFAPISDPGWRALAFSVSYTAVCFLPVWALYRKRIFVKV